MKKMLVIFLVIFAGSLWAHVDIRLGVSANFSALDLAKIGEVSTNLASGDLEEQKKRLHEAINRGQAGIQYNFYSQAGWSWDLFQAGGEVSFGFNAFSNVANKKQWSSIMGLSPRAYFGFDLFLARVTLLTGFTFNFQAGVVPLPKNYNSPKLDLGFRLGVGPLMAEFIGEINVVETSESIFRVGLGLEFTILGG